MGVGLGGAVTGEVLRARDNAATLETGHERGHVPRDELGIRPEGTDTDDGLRGFVLTSATGATSRSTPIAARSAAIEAATR